MPTRYLKPGIRDSELIDRLSPTAEILFYRLLVTVDDFGRFDARPAMVKSHCFPVRDKITPKHCDEALRELSDVGLLDLYEVDAKPYMQLRKWDNIPRSKESKFPAPDADGAQLHTSVCKPRTVLPGTGTGTKTETETETEPRQVAAPTPAGLDPIAWERWAKYRKSIKKPINPASVDAAQVALAKHGQDQAAVVEQSIANGWQGLFPLKHGTQPGAPPPKSFAEQDREAGMRRWEEMTGEVHPDRNRGAIDVPANFLDLGGSIECLSS